MTGSRYSRLTVLVLSRNEPPRDFSSLYESRKIALITTSELAFNSDEIRRYFASRGHVTGSRKK